MNNFVYESPTRLVFGRGTEKEVGALVQPYAKKAMILHYGEPFIYSTGLYDRITGSLSEAGVEFVELAGIVPNPRIDLVRKGIEICRCENVGFLLAVGGGSVIDTAKAISFGSHYDGDPWDFFTKRATVPMERIPVGVVLTIASTGSESNCQSVITNEEIKEKHGVAVPGGFPVFAVMNPEITCTLPRWQTGASCADILAHAMESYIIDQWNVDINDRLNEALMQAVVCAAYRLNEDPADYEARAQIMWASNLACKFIFTVGCESDGTVHILEHELSGWYDITHGAGLAALLPSWLKQIYLDCVPRLAEFACRVWGVAYDFGYPERTALEGIRRLERFLSEIGMPLHLRELGVGEENLEKIARIAFDRFGSITSIREFTVDDYIKILKDAY